MNSSRTSWVKAQFAALGLELNQYTVTRGMSYLLAYALPRTVGPRFDVWLISSTGLVTMDPATTINTIRDQLTPVTLYKITIRIPHVVVVTQGNKVRSLLLDPSAADGTHGTYQPINSALLEKARFEALGFTEDEVASIEAVDGTVRAVVLARRLYAYAGSCGEAIALIPTIRELPKRVTSGIPLGDVRRTTAIAARLLQHHFDLLKL